GCRSVELVGVVVLRHRDGPVGTFLSFEGATTETCLDRIVKAVAAPDWQLPLAVWSAMVGRVPRSFRVRAKRQTKAGKALVSSDAIAEEVAGMLIDRYGWSVDLTSPDLEVRVQLNADELLVSLTALVQPLGGRGCYLAHPGLHPAIAWVLAKCIDIQEGDVVLDPMCGRGVLVCEAALNWPNAGPFLGCDNSAEQLCKAAENLAGARLRARAQLLRANASVNGGIPLPDASVHKLLTDLPFGKQFGTVQGNEALYPAALAELARVLRPGGLAALLTSRENHQAMRAALAAPETGAAEAGSPAAALHRAWVVEHRRSFRLFCKTDACIYLLRRTAAPAPSPAEAVAATASMLETSRRQGTGPLRRKPGFGKLGGETGVLPWEDGTSWHEQWARERPALCPF
ncbi:unnamed protein product, partial [Polarella glacialis]